MAENKKERYTKAQIKSAKTLHYNVDLLEVLLSDDEQYTLADVEKKVKAFEKREVR